MGGGGHLSKLEHILKTLLCYLSNHFFIGAFSFPHYFIYGFMLIYCKVD